MSFHNQLLELAWQRQKAYSENATRSQRRFVFLRTLLAILSVCVVFLSVLGELDLSEWWNWVIDKVLLILPITITALLSFSIKFDRGQNWILLRGHAESLKMEIYYYRTAYQYDRNTVLAERIRYLSEGIRGSPVHQGALSPYEGELSSQMRELPAQFSGLSSQLSETLRSGAKEPPAQLGITAPRDKDEVWSQSKPQASKDDQHSDLNAEQYLEFRLNSQFKWYRCKVKKLALQLQMLEVSVYIFGGVGTFLVASENYKSWVAVTTALTAALTNYLEFKRVESTLVSYNQAADTLYDIRTWWYSLSQQQQNDSQNFNNLVVNCEETIRSEHSSWLQDMQDRLAKLYGMNHKGVQSEESNEAKSSN